MEIYTTIIDNMTCTKYNSTFLITELKSTLQLLIQREPIQGTIYDIDYERMLVDTSNRGKNMLVKLLATSNSYTLITYHVSYHYDVFNKGQHYFEKMYFFF